MEEQQNRESNYFEIKINNDILRIEINNDKIIFTLIIGISYYKYIKEFNYNEIVKELNLFEYKDILSIYNFLIKNECEIIEEEKIKKIKINNKEIVLSEKNLSNDELIKVLMAEIKNQNEKIDKLFKMNEEKDDKINKLTENINELYYIKKERKKNEINLVFTNNSKEDEYYIFGNSFIHNNSYNIDIYRNGCKCDFQEKYYLKKGDNKFKIKIKNKITDFSYMFYNCSTLKNIDELKYLNVDECINFSNMFYGCSSLSDIKPLEKWKVSKCNNFSYMFYRCRSLPEIKPLEMWDVSNCINFSYMFYGCSSLSNVKPLEKWNVSKCYNFSNMFSE